MASQIQFNIGSGNSLVPNGTKPVPESMLIVNQLDPKEHISIKIFNIVQIFSFKKYSCKCCIQNVSHLIKALVC